MVQASEFWDKTAKGYAESPIRDEEAYREKLEITRRYLQPNSEVFEFACGTGTTAVEHAPYVKHILAIDISSGMLEIARKYLDNYFVNAGFEIDFQWERRKKQAAFIVARRPAN